MQQISLSRAPTLSLATLIPYCISQPLPEVDTVIFTKLYSRICVTGTISRLLLLPKKSQKAKTCNSVKIAR